MREVFKLNHCYNVDCLPAMELFPDNYFDLAVVDALWKIHLASLSPALVGGELLFLPFGKKCGPDFPLVGFGELEEICAHVSVLLSAYSQPFRLVVRLACCGLILA